MTTKRPPLALKADGFAAHAIPQPDPVATATQASLPSSPPVSRELRTGRKTGPKPPAPSGQPSRAGKVQVVAWVTEERRSELKIVAAKTRRTVDDLLSSMIDNLIKTHLDD